MTSYVSSLNTFHGTLLVDTSFTGAYDDVSGYSVVRLWCTCPDSAVLRLRYSDVSNDSSSLLEEYLIYADQGSSINSITKKRYAKVQLENVSSVDFTNANIKTKFAQRIPHPNLTYVTDDITANVSVALTDVELSTALDYSAQSITVFGSSTPFADNHYRRLLTDTSGRPLVVPVTSSLAPVIIGGTNSTGAMKSALFADDGRAMTNSTLLIGDISLSGNNPVPIGCTETVGGALSVPLVDSSRRLQVNSRLRVSDIDVSLSNPVPVGGLYNSSSKVWSMDSNGLGLVQAHIYSSGQPLSASNTLPVSVSGSVTAVGSVAVNSAHGVQSPVMIGLSDGTNVRLATCNTSGVLNTLVYGAGPAGQQISFTGTDGSLNTRGLKYTTDNITVYGNNSVPLNTDTTGVLRVDPSGSYVVSGQKALLVAGNDGTSQRRILQTDTSGAQVTVGYSTQNTSVDISYTTLTLKGSSCRMTGYTVYNPSAGVHFLQFLDDATSKLITPIPSGFLNFIIPNGGYIDFTTSLKARISDNFEMNAPASSDDHAYLTAFYI